MYDDTIDINVLVRNGDYPPSLNRLQQSTVVDFLLISSVGCAVVVAV